MSRALKPIRYSQTDYPTFAETAIKTPISVEVLFDILRRPRFADSIGEQYVIDKYLLTLPGAVQDDAGNIWVTVDKADGGKPSTLFSAHTDTVHKAKATDTYKLSIKKAWVEVKNGGVLGADCGTGIWLMLNLIQAKVPGVYIFHREEEIGGNGSQHIVTKYAKVIEGMGLKRCIAFDRKDVNHIITHQGGERCCSDAFAEAFADALNMGTGMTFHGDDTGSFTDSANYTDLIGECTNLSVGYYDQHTQQECQDLSFCTRLAVQLTKVDWEALPTKRAPGEEDPDAFKWQNWASSYRGGNYDSYYGADPLAEDRDNPLRPEYTPRGISRHLKHDFDKMTDLVSCHAAEVADILEQLGYDYDSLATELMDTYNSPLEHLWEDL